MAAMEKKEAAAPAATRTPVFVITVQDEKPKSKKSNMGKSNNRISKMRNKFGAATAKASSTPSSTTNTIHVLVIAHPDDESMFFLPTIQRLRQSGETIWILCLTTGNYDGLGSVRKGEMSRVSALLKIDKLIHLDVEDIQDHPTKSWSLDAVTDQMEQALWLAIRGHNKKRGDGETLERVVLITFDMYGVSGHINHRDTYLGVRNLVLKQQQKRLQQIETSITTTNAKQPQKRFQKEQQEQQQQQNDVIKKQQSATRLLPPLEAWKLETVHFLPIKYLPLLEWGFVLLSLFRLWEPTCTALPKQQQSIVHTATSPTNPTNTKENSNKGSSSTDKNKTNLLHVYRSVDFLLCWQAMATHHSQFVWYRRLFVIFSCYTFVNKLRPVQ